MVGERAVKNLPISTSGSCCASNVLFQQSVPELNEHKQECNDKNGDMVRPFGKPPRASKILGDPLLMKSSSPIFRSSTQPRESLSTDACSSSLIDSKARSASLPRASPSHFLQGFNVVDCFDFRSIPDPPSPVASINRRRASTSVLSRAPTCRAHGLEDVTNQETDGSISKVKAKRKRKSFACARDSIRATDHIEEVPSVPEHQSNEPMQPKTLQVSICLEEDDLEVSRAITKRRKDRQSMVLLPRYPLPEENDLDLYDKTTTFIEEILGPKSPKRDFVGTEESITELRTLVRGYCALSAVDKPMSTEAKGIQKLTGYPIPGIDSKHTKDESLETDNNVIMMNRRRVFSKISPAMATMEKRKEQEIKQWEIATGCRVEKSKRSCGKFKYYSIETNARVPSQDYKWRYMSVLEKQRTHRAAMAQEWMGFLTLSHPDDHLLVLNGKFESSNGVVSTWRQTEGDQLILDCRVDDNDVKLEDTAKQREAFLPPTNENMRSKTSPKMLDNATNRGQLNEKVECADELRITFSEPAESKESSQIIATSSEDTNESRSRTMTPSPLPLNDAKLFVSHQMGTMGSIGPVLVAQSRDEGMEESSSYDILTESQNHGGDTNLLPFPSRETESPDPYIGRAEKKLWKKIDNALKEYSEEVLRISKAKRTEVEEKQQQ